MRVLVLALVLERIGAQSFLPAIDRSTRFDEFAIPETLTEDILDVEQQDDLIVDMFDDEDDILTSVEPLATPRRNYLDEAEELERSAYDLLSPSLEDEEMDEEGFLPFPRRSFLPSLRRLNRTSFLPHHESIVQEHHDSFFRFPESRVGSISVELQSSFTSRKPRTKRWVNGDGSFSETTMAGPDAVEVSVGVEPLLRLLGLLLTGSATSGAALMGTLRLLAPLLVARRVLAYLGDMANDWYTGRYLRQTYRQLHKDYLHFYQVAALIRSSARFLAQFLLSGVLGSLVQALVGLRRYPCSLEGMNIADSMFSAQGGTFWGCSGLWVLATLGGSFAIGKVLSEWHEFLRLTVEPDHNAANTAKTRRRTLLRPLNILEWMRDPDQVVKEVLRTTSTSMVLKPFHPEPIFFPNTWIPVRALQYVAVLREMRTPSMNKVMRRLLVQHALYDEWYRVLMKEKRVALGLGMVSVYAVSTCVLYWTVGSENGLSALLMLPAKRAVGTTTKAITAVSAMQVYVTKEKSNPFNSIQIPINRTLMPIDLLPPHAKKSQCPQHAMAEAQSTGDDASLSSLRFNAGSSSSVTVAAAAGSKRAYSSAAVSSSLVLRGVLMMTITINRDCGERGCCCCCQRLVSSGDPSECSEARLMF